MSGTKVVPIISKNNDLYIAGGPIQKLYRHNAGTPGFSKKHPEGEEVELVLCAAACYKLTTPPGSDKPVGADHDSANGHKKSSAEEEDDGEAMLRAAQLEASKKRKGQQGIRHGGQPVVSWRLPVTRILRVYPLSEWFRAAAKEKDTTTNAPATTAPSAGALPEFGLVMEYLSDKSQPKQMSKMHPLLRSQVALISDKAFQLPCVRYRFYTCKSAIEEQEWVTVFSAAICNYWHEKLEQTVIPDPEVFQFQTWASASPGQLVHVVISTSSCILLEHSQHDNIDQPSKRESVEVKEIKSCVIVSGRIPTLRILSSRGASGSIAERGLCFFTAAAAMELAVELQRIWNLGRKDETPFPFETTAKP